MNCGATPMLGGHGSKVIGRATPTLGVLKGTTMPRSRNARMAGLAYLGLAISGATGYIAIRSQLYDADDAAATVTNLVEHETLARVGVLVDLAIVITQSLAALYFFKLFRRIDSFAAAALAAFGFMGAAAIMVATVFSATALQGAAGTEASTTGISPQLLYDLSESAWDVGGVFFGLWLIPMGWLVLQSINMPRLLGLILVAGGFGYLLSVVVTFLAPDATVVAGGLTALATIGEVWMVGHLLIKSVNPVAAAEKVH